VNLVSGHTQVMDSDPVKANASMDSLELKVPIQDLKEYLSEVRPISRMDKELTDFIKKEHWNNLK